MKRLLLAGSLVLCVALARAQQRDAYGSLVGLADSAASDKGPEAGDIPQDNPSSGQGFSAGAHPGDEPRSGPDAARAARPEKRAHAPAAKPEAAKDDADAPSVAVPAASAPRIWTKVFSALIPSMARAEAFEVAASTAARRPRAEAVRPETAASAAGSVQGLIELVAAATAPAAPAAPAGR